MMGRKIPLRLLKWKPSTTTRRARCGAGTPCAASRPRGCGWSTWGTWATAGAKAAAEALGARVVVPMHYRDGERGFDELATVEDFLRLYPAEQVRRVPGNVLENPGELEPQVAVLTLG